VEVIAADAGTLKSAKNCGRVFHGKRWKLTDTNHAQAAELAKTARVPLVLAELLVAAALPRRARPSSF